MRNDIPEVLFATRADFRSWLQENAATSEGVWLVFDKTKAAVSLSANDALEEALCFGWIDGQMQSINSAQYRKYFAKRRLKSVWSDKNKKTVEVLRGKGMMTELGENAVKAAMRHGAWDAPKSSLPTDGQVAEFTAKLQDRAPAYENFMKMPPSVRLTYTRRYLSFKTEEARQRDFEKIVDRLNQNLKPM
jgi:uncharacterized protein YdeI (YjbR/CyaY-like superfamily)